MLVTLNYVNFTYKKRKNYDQFGFSPLKLIDCDHALLYIKKNKHHLSNFSRDRKISSVIRKTREVFSLYIKCPF